MNLFAGANVSLVVSEQLLESLDEGADATR
jgi:hypothetical protein